MFLLLIYLLPCSIQLTPRSKAFSGLSDNFFKRVTPLKYNILIVQIDQGEQGLLIYCCVKK